MATQKKPDARKVHEMNEERKRNNLKRQGVEYTPQPYPNRTYSEKVNDMNEERKRYNQRKKQYENAFGR